MAKSDEILRKTSEILSSKAAEKEANRLQLEKERRELVGSIGKDVAEMLTPTLERIVRANQISADQIRSIIRDIKIEVPKIPEVKMPPINVPRPNVTVKAPTVNVPKVDVPAPQINFPEAMQVTMDQYDSKRPLPVMMMDTKGKPMSFSMGASGGRANFLTIKDILNSSGSSIIDDDGLLKTSASVSASISQDYGSGEIGSETVRMVMATDAIASVNIVSGSASGTEYTDATNTELGDGGLIMARDAVGSIYGVRIGSGTSEVALRTVQATDAISSVEVQSGTLTAVTTVTDITNPVDVRQVSGAIWSTEAHLHALDGTGAYEQVRTNEGVAVGAVRVVHASDAITSVNVVGANASMAATLQNPDGTTYDGDNPLPVTVSGITDSTTAMVGDLYSDEVDTDSQPVKIGGTARTANPTAVAGGDRVSASFDDVGRQMIRPVQARDLLQTAYATEDEVGEVTLLAGASGVYHDLIYVMGANESDAAINVDIRQTTGGTVQMSLEIPANSTAGVALPVPIPQDHADATWTVQNSASDNSNTNYSVTALFSKEV